jgi:predicted DNA-binding protein (MmcQ/YjbR family)
MNIEELRNHCLAVKDVEECMPFGKDTVVYKVMNKMFAFFPLNPKDNEHFAALKCDPEKTVQLRGKYIKARRRSFHYRSSPGTGAAEFRQKFAPCR